MILSCPGRWRTVGFRNRTVHEYAKIDPEIVRAIVQNEVPRLLEKSELLLKESGHGGS